jgi:glycosyltransferase involved in cell wall biosynthesis
MKEISVVIPVYRSEKTLSPLYAKLSEVLKGMGLAYEIIFVDDRGGAETWRVIESLAGADSNVIGVKLSRNYGQQAATICGFSLASGAWIVTIDDDLEQNPERIRDLYAKAQEGHAVVYGVYAQRTHSWWRNLTSRLVKKLFKIAIPTLNHEYTSYRIIRGDIAKKICDFTSPFPFIDGYLSWITSNYATVSIEHNERKYGKSNYNFRKLLELTINTFVTFSDLPLKFASYAGILSFLAGTLLALYILAGRLLGNITVSGYSSLMAGILLFGGMQMLILGIIGEYLGRIGFKTSSKPLYIVETIHGGINPQ